MNSRFSDQNNGAQALPQNGNASKIAVVNFQKLRDQLGPTGHNAVKFDDQKVLDLVTTFSRRSGINFVFDTSTENTPIIYADDNLDVTNDLAEPSEHQYSAAVTKVAIINVQQTIVGTADGKEASQRLRARFAPAQRELDSLYKQIQDAATRLNTAASTLSENEKTQLAKEYAEHMRTYEIKQKELQTESNEAQRQEVDRIGRKMLQIIDKDAHAAGIGLVIDTSSQSTPVVFGLNGLDITKTIIEQYDRAYSTGGSGSTLATIQATQTPQFTRVVAINMQQAILGTTDGKEASQRLQTRFGPAQKELDSLNKQIQDIQTGLNTQPSILSENEKAQLVRENAQLMRTKESKQEQLQKEGNEAQRQEVDRIGRKMLRIIDKAANAGGYGLVIDSSGLHSNVLYVSDGLDITRTILEEYDRAYFSGDSTTETMQAGTPPAQATNSNDEPTLLDTMQFIQGKLTASGKVSFVAVIEDTVQGTKVSNVLTEMASNIVADAPTCRIHYHWTMARHGQSLSDQDIQFSFKVISNIEVMPLQAALNKTNAAGGHPELVVRSINPQFTTLFITRNDVPNADIHFSFHEQNMADRVAKAMVHAAELCGAGESKEPF